MVVFAVQSIIKDPPFSRIDLISCRNVLIYLGPALQKKVAHVENKCKAEVNWKEKERNKRTEGKT
jgi:chemotaxis methyl-accepting protein methylase